MAAHTCSLNSPSMQRALETLRRHGRLSTIEWQQKAGLCSISTWKSMLVKRGVPIKREIVRRDGETIYYYSLEEEKAA